MKHIKTEIDYEALVSPITKIYYLEKYAVIADIVYTDKRGVFLQSYDVALGLLNVTEKLCAEDIRAVEDEIAEIIKSNADKLLEDMTFLTDVRAGKLWGTRKVEAKVS